MRWTFLVASIILISGCYKDVVEYRQVSVEPPTIYPQVPIDVTKTTIDYY